MSRRADWADDDPTALARLTGHGHPVDRVLSDSKPGDSRETVRRNLRMMCGILQGVDHRSLTHEAVRVYPWHQLTTETAAKLRHDLYRRYTNQCTRNDKISSVRRVVAACFRTGLISALRRDDLLDQLTTISPGPSTRRRRLTHDEITALMEACARMGTPQARARNTAMVALFRTSGMRCSELGGIQLNDWDRDAQTVYLRDTKNGRPHLIYLHPTATEYLERWHAVRDPRVGGALFTPLTGKDRSRSLDRHSIQHMLASRAVAAGIRPFGSHDFRRTFATELLRTHDVALVGKLLNQTKPASTLIYDLAGEDEQRAAVHQLLLPQVTHTDSDAGNAPATGAREAGDDHRPGDHPRAGLDGSGPPRWPAVSA